MITGIVFDIEEFAIHDGPGIRTTVFLKGCPLRCAWCHNPEGLAPAPEDIRSSSGTRKAGTEYTPDQLASLLNAQKDILQSNEGGVTFSGGEPLVQSRFVAEVIDRLDGVHVALDTSGYATEADFRRVVEKCRLVLFDLKLIDAQVHRRWTSLDNKPILANLRILARMNTPYMVRVPLIPGVTDTTENLSRIADTVCDVGGNLTGVELLPYNRSAGAKYAACGRIFRPGFDETVRSSADVEIFVKRGLPASVR